MFKVRFINEAEVDYQEFQTNPAKKGILNQVNKSLAYLQTNPRHPSLNTHEYNAIPHPWDLKGKVFEAYAQNNTPSAYRIFWCYGPEKRQITIIAVTPHS